MQPLIATVFRKKRNASVVFYVGFQSITVKMRGALSTESAGLVKGAVYLLTGEIHQLRHMGHMQKQRIKHLQTT